MVGTVKPAAELDQIVSPPREGVDFGTPHMTDDETTITYVGRGFVPRGQRVFSFFSPAAKPVGVFVFLWKQVTLSTASGEGTH